MNNKKIKRSWKWLFYSLLLVTVSFVFRLVAEDRKSDVTINDDGSITETIFKKDQSGNYRPKRTHIYNAGDPADYGGTPGHPREVNRVITRTGKNKSESMGKVPEHPGY